METEMPCNGDRAKKRMPIYTPLCGRLDDNSK